MTIAWIIALIIIIVGVVMILRGDVLVGIVLILLGLLIGGAGGAILNDNDNDALAVPTMEVVT